jgi:hypothetical protein
MAGDCERAVIELGPEERERVEERKVWMQELEGEKELDGK